MPARSVETLLEGLLDYAGMFPPASLAAGEAMAIYERYRGGMAGWTVGTFVSSVEHLGDLDPAIGPVTIVLSARSEADVERALHAGGRLSIAAVEFRPVASAAVGALAAMIPDDVEVFFEVAADAEMDRCLDAVAASGGSAKLRTGGVTPEAFPSTAAVYRFLRPCADRRLPAKATAGLHHAVVGSYPLTYDAASPTARMYGFLNVSIAAALVHTGRAEEDALSVLNESSFAAFQFGDEGITWRGHGISTSDIAATRQTLFRSFGSCSLQEPLEDLKRMRVI
jgi:hypothetical protein